MLQFITRPGVGNFTPVEQMRLAIQGGCRWVEIDMPDAPDNEVRNVAMDLIQECRDTDTFLLIRDHIDVVDDLKVSGIHVGTVEEGIAARERLGAHAIIGVDVATVEEAKALKKADLDFAFVRTSSPDTLKALVDACHAEGIEEPIVAGAGITLENIDTFVATGVNGVAVGHAIAAAPDPMLYTGQLLEKLLGIPHE